jgi:hypothetical protein
MIREEMAKQQGSPQIMLNQPGKEPMPLSAQQIIDLLSKQGQQIQMYEQRIKELENIIVNLQSSIRHPPSINVPAFSSRETLVSQVAIPPRELCSQAVEPSVLPNGFQHVSSNPVNNTSKSEPLVTLNSLDPTLM